MIVNWNEWNHLLGKMPDRELSELVGCSIKAVYAARRKAGIILKSRCKPIPWSKVDHLLGKVPDEDIAKEIGCERTVVTNRRNKKDILHPKTINWTDEDQKLSEDGKQKCVQCGEIKLLTEYYVTKNKKKERRYKYRRTCRICWQDNNRKSKIKNKKNCANLLGGKCQSCGFSELITSLHFHHVEIKSFNVSDRLRKIKSEMTEELDKCCLLCANCHIAHHSGERILNFKRSDFGWTVGNPS